MPLRDFTVDARLAAESIGLGDLKLCKLRLYDDSRFSWLILIPRRPGLVEIHDLAPKDRSALIEEIAAAAKTLQAVTQCYKINVAALGNQVRQLHVHVIARFEGDAAWPNPVWGIGKRAPYAPAARDEFAEKLRHGFGFD